jgi:nuclear transport factor 2 (NTF2) superfamily protein
MDRREALYVRSLGTFFYYLQLAGKIQEIKTRQFHQDHKLIADLFAFSGNRV